MKKIFHIYESLNRPYLYCRYLFAHIKTSKIVWGISRRLFFDGPFSDAISDFIGENFAQSAYKLMDIRNERQRYFGFRERYQYIDVTYQKLYVLNTCIWLEWHKGRNRRFD